MPKYSVKINQKYIEQFNQNVRLGLSSILRVSDSSYLQVILKEVNKLFRIISGRMTSKRQIPKPEDFPDVKKFNKFLNNIGIDIEKIYSAQNYVEQDLQNVLNFNSLEREKAIHTLSDVQANVYSAYIKSGSAINGTTIIKESFKNDTLPEGSNEVMINLDKEALMLHVSNEQVNKASIDKELINVYFSDQPDEKYKLFPNNVSLRLGSHWQKKFPSESHFWLKENLSTYREGFIDGPEAENAGSCQFEAVATFDYTEDGSDSVRKKVEDKLSQAFNVHSSLIMVDKVNSMQSKYISSEEDIDINPTIKLTIPFKDAPLSSSLMIDLQPNDSEELPSIDFGNSFVYDVQGRRGNFVEMTDEKLEEYSKTGRFLLVFEDGIMIPSRVEITLKYTQNAWTEINYYMVLYNYSAYKSIQLEAFDDAGNINAIFTKVAHIFVDSESDLSNENSRATNVMLSSEVSK